MNCDTPYVSALSLLDGVKHISALSLLDGVKHVFYTHPYQIQTLN